ncbi:hypothetical protein [Bacillus toyonensis]|uniref:hypothetical protein n=1 Tax=Bacillus toyonensis TaxID=155322 RepID=UPI000BF11F9D|nr:hypothetical protein [Bacillus toyonensis]PEM38014.1 hypothetical protein CN636_30230 [Bacillus toyonensis]
MGRLAVRKVKYNGDNYFFESPYLNDGIVIIEGDNEHGKSTLMDLIYFGLGGKVKEFNKNNKKLVDKHEEIYNDTNNFVELHIEINGDRYELTRSFSENKIYIVDNLGRVIETCIYRNSQDCNLVFSDWILKKLDIEVFDIVQGTRQHKIGFTDLLRLIYHDQKSDLTKIYKNAESENFVSDSLEIRKAIFEILIGEVHNEYYELLGKYKIKSKEYENSKAISESFDGFIKEIVDDKLDNVDYFQKQISSREKKLEKLELDRKHKRSNRNSSETVFEEIELRRLALLDLENEIEKNSKYKINIIQSTNRVLYLMDDLEKEIEEIQKIRFVHKKLNLFSPNTCPYCLNDVKREKNRCICGCEIDEEEYEKFFYNDDEYLEVLKTKKKSYSSLKFLLERKQQKLKSIKENMGVLQESKKIVQEEIKDLSHDLGRNYNSAEVKSLDNKILNAKNDILTLQKVKILADKKQDMINKLGKLSNELTKLKFKTEQKENIAKQDIYDKVQDFNYTYNFLMQSADKNCFNAYISEDYFPYTNDGKYRARSALVAKRLIYFVTMLVMSLKYDLHYPQLLLIDTPKKEGIEDENLIRILKQLVYVESFAMKQNKKYQIIMTTGINTYPQEFKNKVILTLEKDNKLLNKKR